MGTSIMWFRRDLRLSDSPALVQAARAAGADGEVVPFFCRDARLERPSGANRLAFMYGCLAALDRSLGGALVVRAGRPATKLPALVRQVGATQVFVTADLGPYGAERDREVERSLADRDVELVRVSTPYAVAPGTVRNRSGDPYKVFTPFSRAWREHGWPDPVRAPRTRWASGVDGEALPEPPPVGARLPDPGEAAAERTARRFLDGPVREYHERRDEPGADGTSRLSPYLKWGCIHPRQLLAGLGGGDGPRAFADELCWREFYADVLHHRPDSARRSLDERMRSFPVDEGPDADDRFAAWREGRTGYPIVDAGMRQLLAEGWMHNRVRMIVASFLVKDLHLDWGRGARHFMVHLVDGDLASNQHGWQWVAGTGTDAAPYFRIFNPVTQAERFDPGGGYVRRWLPELSGVPDRFVHHPWDHPDGPPEGYPGPLVDHGEEREESLRRYRALRR
jgi:deoxyribodipyrimidine photo-lyase